MSSGVHEQRRRAIRSGAVYCCLPVLLAALYVAATWSGQHRPAMLAVILGVLTTTGLAMAAATRLVASKWWMVPQHIGAVCNLAGYVALALLDGGVAGPLGIYIPTSTVLLATVLLPRAFLVVVVLNTIGYAIVVLYGDPAPPGYWLAHGLAFGAAAVLCMRHSRVLASLRRRLADSSRTDPLTGCLNRRGFDQRLAAALGSGRPVTLVLLDLDHFKQVNDAYGHRAGDDLLAWVGQELRAEVRGQGVAGRLGGDEFALLVPGDFRLDGLRERLPSSFGVASCPADGRDPETLAQIADKRLYADKASRERSAPSASVVAAARARIGTTGPSISFRERRRHSIADPGWMSIAQTSVAMVYLALFTAGNPYRAAMLAICLWGFGTGLAVVLGSGWLSRARSARPLMLLFAVSSFVSCAAIAVLDGGARSPLGVGILIAIPLLMLGMRPGVAAPVALLAGALYAAVGVIAGGASAWYVTISLVSTFVISAACALQGRSAAAQRRMLTRLSSVDVLTDVLNRRGFSERFAAVPQPGAALIVADLDGFKQLNDAYGHAAGDELLRWVAATMRAGTGPSDVVGRLGGDEFVIMVHGDAAGTVASLRAALEQRTGVSFGAAVLGVDGDDFDNLYAVADGRLYQEKSARKDETARERETLRG
ncbi:GGDEF domain-containing protein [Actinoplanes sp. NPDC051861]|uniref:GGDEF domain-containing protein n=1 Tax=Actinoplanes sp. NPDC051861 TaxID=3155170 RepID=UPI0034487265